MNALTWMARFLISLYCFIRIYIVDNLDDFNFSVIMRSLVGVAPFTNK